MKPLKLESNIEVKGIHTINIFKTESTRALQLQKWIDAITKRRSILIAINKPDLVAAELHTLSERFQYYIAELRKTYLVRQLIVENITTTVGRQVAAQLLAGTYGGTGAITHTAVGDSNAAALVGNTQLGNETFRRPLTDGNTTGTTTLLETFFLTSEAVDTHEEFGMFIDGSGAANSGIMFNRFTQNVVKSNTESMNVQTSVQWSDA